jgi:hypothetical protein
MNAASMRMLYFIKILDEANPKFKIASDINSYRYGTIYRVTLPVTSVVDQDSLNPDPYQAFQVNPDSVPKSDPGF